MRASRSVSPHRQHRMFSSRRWLRFPCILSAFSIFQLEHPHHRANSIVQTHQFGSFMYRSFFPYGLCAVVCSKRAIHVRRVVAIRTISTHFRQYFPSNTRQRIMFRKNFVVSFKVYFRNCIRNKSFRQV